MYICCLPPWIPLFNSLISWHSFTVFEAIIPTLTQWLGSWSQTKPCFCLHLYLWCEVFLGSITTVGRGGIFPTACAIAPGACKATFETGLWWVSLFASSSPSHSKPCALCAFPSFFLDFEMCIFSSMLDDHFISKAKRKSNLSQQPAHIETISTLPDLAPFWTSSWTARGLILP